MSAPENPEGLTIQCNGEGEQGPVEGAMPQAARAAAASAVEPVPVSSKADIAIACTCHPDDKPYGPCQRRYAASECQRAARECQARELHGKAALCDLRRPLRCWLGFHRFATFERFLFTSRGVCVRCGAVFLSTGFDGAVLNAHDSRNELIDAARAIEARSQ